jgi:hypothetical protein
MVGPSCICFLIRSLLADIDQCSSQFALRNGSNPLLDDISIPIQQEDVGLILVVEHSLELIILAVIDVQINKVNVLVKLSLEPVHDGRQRLAGRSPECEEFDQSRFT